jgi:uncharacterized protein YndB with AHSA1/START domain
MADSIHEIPISADPQKVYAAWTTREGLCAWWTARARIEGRIGGENVFVFDEGTVEFHFRIDEQIPGERVLWTGVAGQGMPGEWIGTRIEVHIAKLADGRTRLRFAHAGWESTQGMYAVCNTTWGELMYRLRDWCEGKGRGPLFA